MSQVKPQIVPRKSLLKKQQQVDEKQQGLQQCGSASPVKNSKPPIAVKPNINSIKKEAEREETLSTIQTNENEITSQLKDSKPMINETDKSSPIVETTKSVRKSLTESNTIISSPMHRSKPIKYLINAEDLNRLRYRRDYFDDKSTSEEKNSLIYDVREDDEQIKKMNEILELLVAGGYFRARIKGLHNFDKVRLRFRLRL